MDASTRFETQLVGSLPLIAYYFELLELSATIDDVVPWEGEVGLGNLVEIMIANRLLQPKALFRIGDWAQRAGLTDYYGVTPAELNDDRLGRALERLVVHAPTIQTALVLKMIKIFKLDVSHIHYDISDVELYGAYEAATATVPPPVPLPAYGRTKSGRKNVKQIQFGLNVTNDGAVPVGHLPLDGNAAEAKTHLENLKQLERVLPKGTLLYTADTKLDVPENLLGIAAGNGQFLCGGAFQPHLQQQYLKLRDRLKPVDYCPKSQAHLPPEKRDAYQACEVEDKLYGEVNGRGLRLKYRLIFIHSQAKARQEAQTRERHVAKIREQFEAVERNLGKYSLKTYEAVVRRLEAAKGKYKEGSVFDYQLNQTRGQLRLQWNINPKAVRELEQLEGIYLLKTNLPKKTHPLAKILAMYKEQSHVERRIANLKGPLAVAPMFLEKPARMAGLLCILVWALMVMALMERAVRRNLKGKPLYGLYPENRPSPAPTGTALLECFSTVSIVIIKHHGTTTRRLAQFTPIQHRLIQLLAIPPTALQTFKRRCGM
jgi:transposase